MHNNNNYILSKEYLLNNNSAKVDTTEKQILKAKELEELANSIALKEVRKDILKSNKHSIVKSLNLSQFMEHNTNMDVERKKAFRDMMALKRKGKLITGRAKSPELQNSTENYRTNLYQETKAKQITLSEHRYSSEHLTHSLSHATALTNKLKSQYHPNNAKNAKNGKNGKLNRNTVCSKSNIIGIQIKQLGNPQIYNLSSQNLYYSLQGCKTRQSVIKSPPFHYSHVHDSVRVDDPFNLKIKSPHSASNTPFPSAASLSNLKNSDEVFKCDFVPNKMVVDNGFAAYNNASASGCHQNSEQRQRKEGNIVNTSLPESYSSSNLPFRVKIKKKVKSGSNTDRISPSKIQQKNLKNERIRNTLLGEQIPFLHLRRSTLKKKQHNCSYLYNKQKFCLSALSRVHSKYI